MASSSKHQPSPSLPPSALPAPGGTHSLCFYIDLCDRRMNVYPSPLAPPGQGLCFAQGYILSPSIEPGTKQIHHNVSGMNDLVQL